MDAARPAELLAHTTTAIGPLAEALAGIDLDARPAEREWSAREIVHHLADSELTSAVHLRRLLTEDDPQILGYDENLYSRRLHYDRDIQASLAAFKAARESTGELLDRLSVSDWSRRASHTEFESYGVELWLQRVASHPHEHANQIR